MPKLTIIAGPNGSGKSTLTRNIQSSLNVPIIDPDAEARKINASNPEIAAVAAGKLVIRLAHNYLNIYALRLVKLFELVIVVYQQISLIDKNTPIFFDNKLLHSLSHKPLSLFIAPPDQIHENHPNILLYFTHLFIHNTS